MAFWTIFAIVTFYNLDIEQIVIKIAISHSIIGQVLYIKVIRNYEQL